LPAIFPCSRFVLITRPLLLFSNSIMAHTIPFFLV
jgi:hypothetical protein